MLYENSKKIISEVKDNHILLWNDNINNVKNAGDKSPPIQFTPGTHLFLIIFKIFVLLLYIKLRRIKKEKIKSHLLYIIYSSYVY